MTDRMSDSIRERKYGQNCHKSSQLSQKITIVDICHKNPVSFTIFKIATFVSNNCHLLKLVTVAKISQNSYY